MTEVALVATAVWMVVPKGAWFSTNCPAFSVVGFPKKPFNWVLVKLITKVDPLRLDSVMDVDACKFAEAVVALVF